MNQGSQHVSSLLYIPPTPSIRWQREGGRSTVHCQAVVYRSAVESELGVMLNHWSRINRLTSRRNQWSGPNENNIHCCAYLKLWWSRARVASHAHKTCTHLVSSLSLSLCLPRFLSSLSNTYIIHKDTMISHSLVDHTLALHNNHCTPCSLWCVNRHTLLINATLASFLLPCQCLSQVTSWSV